MASRASVERGFYRGRVCAPCVRRKSIERKTSLEKRDKEREHVDDAKKKEKEKPVKEETTKRPEKEIKKMEPIAAKKLEPSVSPKKLQISSLPVTRHRVSLNSLHFNHNNIPF